MLEKLLAALIAIDSRLSWGRAALWAFTTLVGIVLYQAAEQRAVIVPHILGNQLVMSASFAVGVLATVAFVGARLLSKIESKQQELQQFMESRIHEMDQQIEQSRAAEAICRSSLEDMWKRLRRAERLMSAHGIDPEPTET